MTPFATIRARAVERKGGTRTLTTLLPRVVTRAELTALPDDRILSEMTKRIFCSGFAWTVVEQKWPGFEAAFLAFDPAALLIQPPDFWDALTGDTRIVRHGQKITTLTKAEIREGLEWAISKPWVDEATQSLFQEGLRLLRHLRHGHPALRGQHLRPGRRARLRAGWSP